MDIDIRTLNHYQEEALVTAIYPNEFATIYPALGMAGEAGEVADKIKKLIRDKELVRNEDGKLFVSAWDEAQIAKEIGDVLWYCAVLSHDLGYTLQEVAEMNIRKLRERQRKGTINGSGDNR